MGPVGVFFANKISVANKLALYNASERVCLWYRAHEIVTEAQLAKYFETAVLYFLESWYALTSRMNVANLHSHVTKQLFQQLILLLLPLLQLLLF